MGSDFVSQNEKAVMVNQHPAYPVEMTQNATLRLNWISGLDSHQGYALPGGDLA